jgi:hypothetical protein
MDSLEDTIRKTIVEVCAKDDGWLQHTPWPVSEKDKPLGTNGYRLEVWVESAGDQEIELTRQEYIELKQHLAMIRLRETILKPYLERGRPVDAEPMVEVEVTIRP